MKHAYGLLIMVTLFTLKGFSQELKEEDYYNLSLEELMTIPIESASKTQETLFEAPLSSYTITRADIDKAGSTSIVEALRLAPGIIVREQTNGVYDVHIRGFDNILATSQTYTKSNLATLVMIDHRPVFNHNLGGTFWDALPVDINDVERIEIVRGPSAPMFGPNAVTGVINIITRKIDKSKKSILNASVTGGSSSTIIGNLSAGKSFGKFNAIVSGNFQKRDRFDNEYYLPATKSFHSLEELSNMIGPGINEQYPDASLALKKFGLNARLGYDLSESINFSLNAGVQESESQKIFLSNRFNGRIPFTTNQTETFYMNFSGNIRGLSFRSSYLPGHDNLVVNSAPNQYDYDLFDASAEYTIKIGSAGSIAPGVSFQNAAYGDEQYVADGLTFLKGTTQSITTTSAFLRTDFKPLESLRVLAALRADKFSAPDEIYLAYEFAATYKVNPKNLLRLAVTRSNSGSFIGNNYLNVSIPNQPQPGLTFLRRGRDDLKLLTVNMIELGYRIQINKNLQFDLDFFQQNAANFAAMLTLGMQGSEFIQECGNVPTTAQQRGATFSMNFVPNDRLQVKPFITAQRTQVKDLPSSFNSPSSDPALTYADREHENTPSVYGGYFINYKATSKVNVNLNGYFYSSHRQYDESDPLNTGKLGHITGTFLVNAKVNYALSKQFNLFINGRNMLNAQSREFFAGDKIGSMWLAGASLNLN